MNILNSPSVVVSVDPFDVEHYTIGNALAIAKEHKKPLYLHGSILHSRPVQPENVVGYSTAAALAESQIKKGEQLMQSLVSDLRKEWPAVRSKVEVGFRTDKLLSTVNKKDFDPYLLVVGRKAEPGFFNQLFGTPSTIIAESAKCPVLVVPPETTFKGFPSVRYVMERGNIDLDQIKFLVSLVKPWKGYISIIYLSDSEKSKEELGVIRHHINEAVDYDIDVFEYNSINSGKEALELNNMFKASLFAFPHREMSIFERMYADDNTRKLILESSTPVIVF